MTIPPQSTSAQFAYRNLTITLNSNLNAPLLWLNEFLNPWFNHDPSDQHSQHQTINLVFDTQRYNALNHKASQSTTQPINCFTMDSQFDAYPLWCDNNSERIIHCTPMRMMLIIPKTNAPITIVAPADHPRTRVGIMRVIREIATQHALQSHDLFMHGAVVEHNHNSIAIVGQKRAGKTTMLLNALQQPHTSFITNDRIFIQTTATTPIARGMPTIIKIRSDSLNHLPKLSPPSFNHPHRHYLTLAECASPNPMLQPAKHDPPSMSAAQFCQWLNVSPIPAAPLKAIVFTQVDPTLELFQLRQLNPTQATQQIKAGRFPIAPDGPTPTAFNNFHPKPAPLDQPIEHLANNTLCLECRVGPNAFKSPNIWPAIIDSIHNS